MSEGYERRPEERWIESGWTLFIVAIFGLICGGVIVHVKNGASIVALRAENAALTKQLDFHTCRVQFEPMPVPEQIGEGPTLADHPSIEEEIADATRMPAGVYGSPAQDLRAEWMTAYHRGQKIKHAECDHCEACGITEEKAKEQGGELNDHHVVSVKRIFTEGLDPALIGDPKNLIRLCRNCGGECHFRIGHDPDGPNDPRKPTWSESNPNVRRDAAKRLSKSVVVP